MEYEQIIEIIYNQRKRIIRDHPEIYESKMVVYLDLETLRILAMWNERYSGLYVDRNLMKIYGMNIYTVGEKSTHINVAILQDV